MGKYTKIITGGLLLYGSVAGATFLYLRPKCGQAPSSETPHPSCGCNSTSFDRLADSYDTLIGFDEALMGINLLRRWYISRNTKGDVLEVSAGTGRNLPYYPLRSMKSLTLTDVSKEMLWHAKEKYAKMMEQSHAHASTEVGFKLADAQHLTGRSPPEAGEDVPKTTTSQFIPASFDTVVDTFGLCSIPDPVTALQEMAKVLRPGGRLVLIEHGRSSLEWLNRRLDKSAEEHFSKWGCRWNLDIMDLCKQAGLQVDYVSRWHFGTTYIILAKPGEKVNVAPSSAEAGAA
eukprot:jgi/Botrbrau1/1726/Bobra.116_2s0068.1